MARSLLKNGSPDQLEFVPAGSRSFTFLGPDPVQGTPLTEAPPTYMCECIADSTGIRTHDPCIMRSSPEQLCHRSTQAYVDLVQFCANRFV